jgi:hypothetical protein
MFLVTKNGIHNAASSPLDNAPFLSRKFHLVYGCFQDQKKLQEQLMAEQEALYGSKPSPSKPLNGKKTPKHSTGVPNRRLSVGGAMNQHSKTDIAHSNRAIRAAKKADEMGTLSPGMFLGNSYSFF